MSDQVVFVVTEYGCNSYGHDMWPPKSKVFSNYEDAYSYFLMVSPNLNDQYNKAEKTVFKNIDINNIPTEDCIIENRRQIPGYLSGDGYCAKRPKGTVISACVIRN